MMCQKASIVGTYTGPATVDNQAEPSASTQLALHTRACHMVERRRLISHEFDLDAHYLLMDGGSPGRNNGGAVQLTFRSMACWID